MTAIEEYIESSAAPVRLAPWLENPYGLVTLWQMQQILAGDFCRASGNIGQLFAQIQAGIVPKDGSWHTIVGELGMLEKYCDALGFVGALAQIRRVKQVFFDDDRPRPSFESLARDVMEIHTRLVDDMHSRVILVLQADRAGYYDGSKDFGLDVQRAFPSVAYDVTEAGKAYACNRSTACVFHLMRVLEIGLSVFAIRFNVPHAHTNWQNIIEGIEKAVRNMGADPNRPPDWKDQQEFYSQAASNFMVLKDAWRNYTAHARGKYTEDEALTILINVRSFMQKLATRLHE
jgi:hypothetical protein